MGRQDTWQDGLDEMNVTVRHVQSVGRIAREHENDWDASEKSFVCRGVSQNKTSPEYLSKKTYDISALYISVRNRRIDEFWDAG